MKEKTHFFLISKIKKIVFYTWGGIWAPRKLIIIILYSHLDIILFNLCINNELNNIFFIKYINITTFDKVGYYFKIFILFALLAG